MSLRAIATLSLVVFLASCSEAAPAGRSDGGPDTSVDAGELEAPFLSSLALSPGVISPAFDPTVTEYTFSTSAALLRVSATSDEGIVTVDGAPRLEDGNFAPTPLVSSDGRKTVIEVSVAGASGATRSYRIVATTKSIYVKASNAGAYDDFGVSVAISGDTLVVGASGEASGVAGINADQTDDSVRDSGAVYVFVREGASWVQQAYLKSSDPQTLDWFGSVVALDGDTLAVSAYGKNGEAHGSGAVFVFVRHDGTWTQQAHLTASNPGYTECFGMSLALSGDTLVAGTPNEDSPPGDPAGDTMPDSGAVYVFVRSGETWSEQAILKASNAEAFDDFGTSVALVGQTLAIGAPGESSAATGVDGDQQNNDLRATGAVYLFVGGGATWTQQAYLKASVVHVGDRFGSELALDGDTLAIAASGVDAEGVGAEAIEDSGAVYVFTKRADGWRQQTVLTQLVPGYRDFFGVSLSLRGDTLVVGASGEDARANGIGGDEYNDEWMNSGAAYLYTRSGENWIRQAYLKASNTGERDSFGFAVACDGDTVVVAAPGESSAATGIDGDGRNDDARGAGAVYVF